MFNARYDRSSKVLEILDEGKLQKFQEILEKIYKETNVEDIEGLVEYFANSLREVILPLIRIKTSRISLLPSLRKSRLLNRMSMNSSTSLTSVNKTWRSKVIKRSTKRKI